MAHVKIGEGKYTSSECDSLLFLEEGTAKLLIKKYKIPLFIVDSNYKITIRSFYNAYLTECSRLWYLETSILEVSIKLSWQIQLMTMARSYLHDNLSSPKTKQDRDQYLVIVENMILIYGFKQAYSKKRIYDTPSFGNAGDYRSHASTLFQDDEANIHENTNVCYQAWDNSESILKDEFYKIFEKLIKENDLSYLDRLEYLHGMTECDNAFLHNDLIKESETLKKFSYQLWLFATFGCKDDYYERNERNAHNFPLDLASVEAPSVNA